MLPLSSVVSSLSARTSEVDGPRGLDLVNTILTPLTRLVLRLLIT